MKFFVYARKSTDDEDRQILSIEAQLAELREYAAKESIEVAQEYVEAMTAKHPGRPVFNQMVKAVEKGQAQGILAWHPDRLARNSVDGGWLVHLLDIGKLAALRFPTFWFEPTPQGKLVLSIALGMAKYYVDQLSEVVKRGFRQKVRNGWFPGRPPVGYLNEPRARTIVIDQDKAPLVRRLFEEYATGSHTFEDFLQFAGEWRLTSFNGGPIYKSIIPRILSDPFYTGVFRFKGELHDGKHEPLISRRLFDEVQDIMRRKGRNHQNHVEDRLPFLGLMKCHVCESGVTAQRQKGHHYYCCTRKKGPCTQTKYAREELLAEALSAAIRRVSLSDEHTAIVTADMDRWQDQARETTATSIARRRERLAGLEAKLQRLLDVYLEDSISREEYTARKEGLIAEKTRLMEELTETERKGNSWIEPMRAFITQCNRARSLADASDMTEMAGFARKTGLNLRLMGACAEPEGGKGAEIWLRKSADWKSGRLPIRDRLRARLRPAGPQSFGGQGVLPNPQNPSENRSPALSPVEGFSRDARLRASPQHLDVRGLLSLPSVFCFQVADRQPVLRVEYPMPWKIAAEIADCPKWSGRRDLNP